MYLLFLDILAYIYGWLARLRDDKVTSWDAALGAARRFNDCAKFHCNRSIGRYSKIGGNEEVLAAKIF